MSLLARLLGRPWRTTLNCPHPQRRAKWRKVHRAEPERVTEDLVCLDCGGAIYFDYPCFKSGAKPGFGRANWAPKWAVDAGALSLR